MGWSEGSIIAEEVWNIIKPYIGKDERTLAEVSKRIYEIFESRDADDWGYQLQYKKSLYYTYMKYRLYFQNDSVKLNLIGTASLSYESTSTGKILPLKEAVKNCEERRIAARSSE